MIAEKLHTRRLMMAKNADNSVPLPSFVDVKTCVFFFVGKMSALAKTESHTKRKRSLTANKRI